MIKLNWEFYSLVGSFLPLLVVVLVVINSSSAEGKEVRVLGVNITKGLGEASEQSTTTTQIAHTNKQSLEPTNIPVTPTEVPASSTPTAIPVTSTNTPAPTPTPTPSGQYVVNGATFSSLYPTVSLKPGEQKTAFAITSTGTKNFEISDARVVGATGISFSSMTSNIEPGQTKDIIISADASAQPGTYGGFIGIKVDSGFPERKLNITVTITGGDASAKSIKITGPTGGSVFKEGEDITITWEANNISDKFGISVSGENGSPLTFINELDNGTRSYTWKATRFFAPNSTHFRFTVSAGNIIGHAESDIIINP